MAQKPLDIAVPLHTDRRKVTDWNLCLDIVLIVAIVTVIIIAANSRFTTSARTFPYKLVNGDLYDDDDDSPVWYDRTV
jgi:hypothetical protein